MSYAKIFSNPYTHGKMAPGLIFGITCICCLAMCHSVLQDNGFHLHPSHPHPPWRYHPLPASLPSDAKYVSTLLHSVGKSLECWPLSFEKLSSTILKLCSIFHLHTFYFNHVLKCVTWKPWKGHKALSPSTVIYQSLWK